ncbi:MAG: undecaprenyl-phosphate galactose phosphotransferase WbaP [Longimicrobiales bacterium]|nr:undecaprenyl-phosphate galactose phosphotransferase WbaP [Longimicrobiales bacterium]
MPESAQSAAEQAAYQRRSALNTAEWLDTAGADAAVLDRPLPRIERRSHWREAPPAVPNGITYSLRALAISLPLVASDVLATVASVLVASAVVGAFSLAGALSTAALAVYLAIALVGAQVVMGLYPAIGVSTYKEMRRSIRATLLVVAAFLLAGGAYGAGVGSYLTILLTGVGCLLAVPLFRVITRRGLARFSWWTQPVVIFDFGPASRHVAEHFSENPGFGLRPVLVDPEAQENGLEADESLVAQVAARYDAVCAAFPMEGATGAKAERILRDSVNTFPHLVIVPDMKGAISRWREATDLDGMIGFRGGKNLLLPGPRAAKRAVDCLLALAIGVVALPLGLLIALAIKLTSRGPVFYGQKRVGQNRTPFLAWKFRTMHPNADELLEEYLASDPELRAEWEQDHKLREDPRLTPLGSFLRKTSLDELPQLWNILVGEMSLVGPRPVVEDEAVKYGPEFGRYLSVPPGLTGLWQVSGRNWTTYDERIRLDAYYVENWSLMFDFYILARTVKAVATGHGAY